MLTLLIIIRPRVYFKPVNNSGVKQVYNLLSSNKNYQRDKRFQVEREKRLNCNEIPQYLKMMTGSSRLGTLGLLSYGELRVCNLLEHFPFSRSTLNHHMRVLKDNNLITSRKDDNKILYKLNHNILGNIIPRLTLPNPCTVPRVYKTVEKGEC